MVVADGVGGNMCGEIASRLAVQTLQQHFEKAEKLDPKTFLSQAVTAANQGIRNYVNQHPECKGMATTLTATVIRFPELHLLQVGDSRAYLLRGKTLQALTEDHTLVRKMVNEGVLSPEEALTHPKRHVIINALGISPEQKFDYRQIVLRPSDQVLLCSDGLYDEVPESEIRDVLLDHSPKEAIRRLVSAANAAGGKDNISITLAVLDDKVMAGTRRFDTEPDVKSSKKSPLKWLAVLLCLLILAGGAWYLGRSTEMGKRARNFIYSSLGMGSPHDTGQKKSAGAP